MRYRRFAVAFAPGLGGVARGATGALAAFERVPLFSYLCLSIAPYPKSKVPRLVLLILQCFLPCFSCPVAVSNGLRSSETCGRDQLEHRLGRRAEV